MRPKTTAWLTGALGAMLILAGCTGNTVAPTPDDPDVEVPQATLIAGACLNADAAAPDVVESNVVDCDDPHTHEILASVDIPKDYLFDWDATEEDYRSLSEAINGRAENARALQFAVWSKVVCEGGMQNRSGLADLEVDGTSALEARVVPYATNAVVEARFQPVDVWTERPKVFCVRELIEPVDGGLSAVPPPSQRDLRTVTGFTTVDFLTSEVSPEGRVCADRDGNWQTCLEPHYAERLFSFSAHAVLNEEEFEELSELRTTDPVDGGEAEAEFLERFREACEDAFDDVLGAWDADLVTAEIDYGEGWVQRRDVPRIVCSVVPVDADAFDLPGGSLIGSQSAETELIDRF